MMAEIARKKLEGQLVDADLMTREMCKVVEHMKAHLRLIPQAMASRLAMIKDPAAVQALLLKEIDLALDRLADTEVIPSPDAA